MRRALAPSRLLLAALLVACGGSQTPEDGEPSIVVELVGNRIMINQSIPFEHDSDALLPDAGPILDEVARVIVEHTEIVRVQVQGHTSVVGQEQRNQELSTQRAARVAEELRGRGVAVEVTSQGYGQTYPLCQDETDECHARNRRVEFFVDVR